jgi:chromate transport protein ChrA
MSLDVLRLPKASERLAPVDARLAPFFCLLLLTAACALASLVFACATPLAAFAVIASAMLTLPSALAVIAVAWTVNQAIGFGALGYPHDANTMLWGLAIAAAALVATAAARLVIRALPRVSTPALLGLALVAAYAAYEIVLFAVTPFLGGEGAFTLGIVSYIGILNLLWLAGLVAVCALVRLLGASRGRQAIS